MLKLKIVLTFEERVKLEKVVRSLAPVRDVQNSELRLDQISAIDY